MASPTLARVELYGKLIYQVRRTYDENTSSLNLTKSIQTLEVPSMAALAPNKDRMLRKRHSSIDGTLSCYVENGRNQDRDSFETSLK